MIIIEHNPLSKIGTGLNTSDAPVFINKRNQILVSKYHSSAKGTRANKRKPLATFEGIYLPLGGSVVHVKKRSAVFVFGLYSFQDLSSLTRD